MEAIEILKEKRSDLFKVDPRVINVTGENPRTDFGDLESLKESIRENGVEVPLMVYKEKGEYFLINGERRLRASMLLVEEGVELRIPITLKPKPTMEQLLIDMFVTNDGKGFTVIEEADLVNRLFKLGLTGTEIAKKLARTEAHVSNMKKLNDIPSKLKNRISKNEVSATTVLGLLKEKELTADEISAHIETIIENNTANGVSKARVTKTDITAAKGQYNSLSLLKKVIAETKPSKAGNREVYDFLRDIYKGKLSKEKIMAFLQIEE